MAMHDTNKKDRKYDRSHRDRSDRTKDDKHDKHDRSRKSKRRHRSRSRSNNHRRDYGRYDDERYRKHRRYDEKYISKRDEYVDNYKNYKSDFNNISENKYKSKTDRHGDKSRRHKERSISAESDYNSDGISSTESKSEQLLKDLRLKRIHLIAELSNHEKEVNNITSESPNNSIGTPEEININFEPLNEEIIDIIEEVPVTEPVKANADCFDMFADTFDHNVKQKQVEGTIAENHNLTDNWDDSEGYYNVRLGEIIDGRYNVFNLTGKGVFSNVVKARDIANNNQEVAIKFIRNNDMMHRAGMKESEFLKKINEMDKNDKYHCVRMLRTFVHKKHLCLVFECMEMNLRDVLKKYGRNVGLNINAIRSYAQQMLLSLKLIKKAELIHADIKPDNILVNDSKTVLKLSDFGSAMSITENETTEYLVSRFYRAPEIIMGIKYDCGVDMWAIAVTLFELYTGQIMFPGKDNNDMLRLMQEAKGRFPNKMIKKGEFRDKYFDEQFNFLQKEVDKITEMEKVRIVKPSQPKALSYDLFLRSKHRVQDHDQDSHKVKQFRDFLDRMLSLDPAKRISINECLSHPFITDSLTSLKK